MSNRRNSPLRTSSYGTDPLHHEIFQLSASSESDPEKGRDIWTAVDHVLLCNGKRLYAIRKQIFPAFVVTVITVPIAACAIPEKNWRSPIPVSMPLKGPVTRVTGRSPASFPEVGCCQFVVTIMRRYLFDTLSSHGDTSQLRDSRRVFVNRDPD